MNSRHRIPLNQLELGRRMGCRKPWRPLSGRTPSPREAVRGPEVARATGLTRAAAQGEATAQFMLGLLYDKGQGVEESFAKAYFWLDISAAHSGAGERDFRMRVRDAVRNDRVGRPTAYRL